MPAQAETANAPEATTMERDVSTVSSSVSESSTKMKMKTAVNVVQAANRFMEPMLTVAITLVIVKPNQSDKIGVTMDSDEIECVLANLIYKGYIKGYLSHQHAKLVLSKNNAFPALREVLGSE